MANIKFSYRYRDAGNFKNHGWIIFANPEDIELQTLETLNNDKLIDGLWFYADQWQLPDLHFSPWNNQLDHTWHEFESVEFTNEPSDTEITLASFMSAVENLKPFNW